MENNEVYVINVAPNCILFLLFATVMWTCLKTAETRDKMRFGAPLMTQALLSSLLCLTLDSRDLFHAAQSFRAILRARGRFVVGDRRVVNGTENHKSGITSLGNRQTDRRD